ncbi:MAG: hypothetical protein L3K00_01910 [Thermoplasmata archaeon]|nr:hypothetical protein [Thermoplasmata archaeon]MCI4362571.1 hypothetical protein [Thermoplasmata archaeon]
MLHCPFCASPETDRIDLDGRRFVVFACMFTPEVDPAMSDEQVTTLLATAHPTGGGPYFRGMCDRLHLYVTAGEGGKRLTSPSPVGRDPAAGRT